VKKVWRIWAKALGDKSGKNDREADFIAIIRTFIFIQLITTNCFIVSGVIRHWNANQKSGTQLVAPVDSSAIIKTSKEQQ
tara:strand:+ start:330 stop:569 length:240 start_codon:yes stop_codon:yes gene_type:complete